MRAPAGQRVVAITGGGGGIGAAIAEELGRQGAFVVTMDPLVSLDGTEQLPAPEETTAGRIVANGGSAVATSVSVTDADAVRGLFDELGRLDAVVNVAGISRPTSFAKGTEDDWRSVLAVHLDGYLNVLSSALPIMAAAGHGRILGVTSGSGWRQADAGAYGCAKRAVAALTWQVGRLAPPGVVVNAMSPIAVTRMVTAALSRGRGSSGTASGSASTGGLALGSMPAPEELAPFAAHLISEELSWCSGRVLFAAGSEVAVIDEPRLLEVVRSHDVGSLAQLLEIVGPGALVPAEAQQVTSGAGNPRFGPIFDHPETGGVVAETARSCAVVAERPEVAAAVTAALEARGATCRTVRTSQVAPGFAGAADALASIVAQAGTLDGVVVALGGPSPTQASPSEWERVLAEHAGIVGQVHADASWARAVADQSAGAGRPIRLVTLTEATTAGGRSRAQAAAQLARAGRGATADRVAAFAVSVEVPHREAARPVAELAAHLLCNADAAGLAGSELVVGRGWFGLRSHPRPSCSVTYGGPAVPDWLDDTLRSIVGQAAPRLAEAP